MLLVKTDLLPSSLYLNFATYRREISQQEVIVVHTGKAISLLPSDSELITQQAADILNVSRPHVVKLLEEGVIPFKKVGSHRRILLEDLLVYANQQKETRKEHLQFLTQQAQALNLGYE